MNYQNIKQECPLLQEEFNVWLFNEFGAGWDYVHFLNEGMKLYPDGTLFILNHRFNDRDLYTYFDSIGVIIDVVFSRKVGFYGTITTGKRMMRLRMNFTERIPAETAAFTKAFHIKESQLNISQTKESK